ncbi:retrovirus-related pol polyprotein from transposon TNT 1-94 [Tanacetum coccineum]
MASVSPICLMACATSTKSWLWHQRLSYLNFDTINDLDRNDLVTGLPKFKYHKEHLCPSCEQGKSKRASHPPKPVPNSKQMLHLLHMDLCGPIRIASINGKRYVLVIIDDYSRYTWVVFLRSKDEATKAIKTFLKRINVLLQAPVIIRVYNRRTQKIMETMNVTFDELLAMAFEQSSLKPGLQSMTSGQITMYDDHVGGQPSAALRTVPAAQDPQGLQTPTNVDELETQQQHGQPHHATIVDNVPNAIINDNTFLNHFAPPSSSAAESSSSQYVTDIAQKEKNKAKRTKPITGMERDQETETKGVPHYSTIVTIFIVFTVKYGWMKINIVVTGVIVRDVELIIQQKVKEKQEEKNIAEKAADHRTRTPEFLDSFKLTYKKSTIPLNNTPLSPDFSDFPPQPQYKTYSYDDDDDDEYTIKYRYEEIDYIEASPPVSELVSLEEVKDDILREKLLNINLLIAKIEYLNDNSTPDCVFKSPIPVKDSDSFFEKSDTSLSYSDNSFPRIQRILAIIRKSE